MKTLILLVVIATVCLAAAVCAEEPNFACNGTRCMGTGRSLATPTPIYVVPPGGWFVPRGSYLVPVQPAPQPVQPIQVRPQLYRVYYPTPWRDFFLGQHHVYYVPVQPRQPQSEAP